MNLAGEFATDRVGMEYPEVYDGVLFWHCRVCDGTWNADINDYERMCVSCHRAYDAQRRAATGERTSPVRRSA